ncbi:MAG: DUF5056 domain-containing protein [Mediterranea sp.]|nr:DUF5056 domain-containing protein [Mediterranea sp.]
MTEIDDKLLKQFFEENRQEIADDGFTHRVMRRLPDRSKRIAQIWSFLTFALAAYLFYVMGGVTLAWETLRETFSTIMEHTSEQADPRIFLIAALVLLVLGYRKICSLA